MLGVPEVISLPKRADTVDHLRGEYEDSWRVVQTCPGIPWDDLCIATILEPLLKVGRVDPIRILERLGRDYAITPEREHEFVFWAALIATECSYD